jgi:hypothetical protein
VYRACGGGAHGDDGGDVPDARQSLEIAYLHGDGDSHATASLDFGQVHHELC